MVSNGSAIVTCSSCTASSLIPSLLSTSALDPGFLAAVVQGVKHALDEDKAKTSSMASTVLGQVQPAGVVHPSLVPVTGGVMSHEVELGVHTAAFLASGASFSVIHSSSPAPQGRPAFVVPSFVSTFNAPCSSSTVSSSAEVGPLPVPLGDGAALFGSTTGPVLNQPFVIGPGFPPIPAKIVAQILAGEFVDLSDLLTVNIVQAEPESHVLLDGRLVFTPSTKRQCRRIDNIVTWNKAFTIFTLILTLYFPQCWRDLTLYKLLINRTYRQFTGRVWLAYDQAFCKHASGH